MDFFSEIAPVALSVGIAVASYMTVWFFVSVLLRRNDVADAAWGIGFIVAASTVLAVSQESVTTRFAVALGCIVLWGVRLSFHIFARFRKKKEDSRYAKWREEWGRWFYVRSYFQVFVLQGILLLLVVSPVILLGALDNGGFNIMNALGLSLWMIGFLFETVGDWQLSRFLSSNPPKGAVMRSGLWRYTRHPNYFGEVTLWWGMFLLTMTGQTAMLLGILGPFTITFLILKVSGIPMLEKPFEGNPEFESYKRRTSAFFPLPPRRAD